MLGDSENLLRTVVMRADKGFEGDQEHLISCAVLRLMETPRIGMSGARQILAFLPICAE
jgi:hypothetical protein